MNNTIVRFCAFFASIAGFLFLVVEQLGGWQILPQFTFGKWSWFSLILLSSIILGSLGVFLGREKANGQKLKSGLQAGGPRGVGATRLEVNYLDLVQKSKHRFWALGISLPYFGTEAMIEGIRAAAMREVDVRILMNDPRSFAMKFRPSELYPPGSGPKTSALSTLNTLWHLKCGGLPEDKQKHLKLAITDVALSIGAIISDDGVVWSPYLLTSTGAKSPYMVTSTTDIVFGQKIAAHFGMLWDEMATRIDDVVIAEL